MPAGRPSKYTPELAKEICDAIASSSKGLETLCKENPHWPAPKNINIWRRKHEEFRIAYAQSKIDQIETLVDEILEIADDTSKDTIIKVDENENEKETYNAEWVNRSRLRIDTRKWLAAKLVPRLYGDRAVKNDEDKEDFISKHRDEL